MYLVHTPAGGNVKGLKATHFSRLALLGEDWTAPCVPTAHRRLWQHRLANRLQALASPRKSCRQRNVYQYSERVTTQEQRNLQTPYLDCAGSTKPSSLRPSRILHLLRLESSLSQWLFSARFRSRNPIVSMQL